MTNWTQIKPYSENSFRKTDIVDAVAAVAERVDGRLTVQKYKAEKSVSDPSYQTMLMYFDGWEDVLSTASVDRNVEDDESTQNVNTSESEQTERDETVVVDEQTDLTSFSEIDCRTAIRSVARSISAVPSISEYDSERSDEQPLSEDILSVYDSWQAAIEDAELRD